MESDKKNNKTLTYNYDSIGEYVVGEGLLPSLTEHYLCYAVPKKLIIFKSKFATIRIE